MPFELQMYACAIKTRKIDGYVLWAQSMSAVKLSEQTKLVKLVYNLFINRKT